MPARFKVMACFGEVRRQVIVGDGPAAVGHPVAGLIVNRVKGHATPTPDGRRAAKTPVPVFVGWAVHALVGHGAFVQGLCGGVFLLFARFHQQHAQAFAHQLQGHADASGACTHDADVSLQGGAIGHLAHGLNHGALPLK